MKSPNTPRRDQLGNPLLQEHVHDPYIDRGKLKSGTRCTDCNATYVDGRWTWQKAEETATQLCPACRRIRDRVPAGELVLMLPADDEKLDEILRRVENLADGERQQHPLHRIIEVQRGEEETTVTTTDIHLPHRFGHGVKDAWGGQVETHYDPAGYFARVVWRPKRD